MAETNIVWASTAEHFQRWNTFITSHPAGMAHLLSWYLDHQQHRMARAEMVYAQQNGEAVAGAVMYTFTLPARQRICLVPSGPLEFPGQSKSLLAVLQAIGERCAAIGAAVLQFEAFEAEMRDQIRDAFDGRHVANEPLWRLYHPTLWRELRVDLVGKTPATLLAGFSGVPRRLVQQAIKHETQVL